MLRQVRRMANDARAEVTRELGPELKDISTWPTSTRATLVRKHLLEPLDLDDLDDLGRTGSTPARRDQAGARPSRGHAARRTTRTRPSGSAGPPGLRPSERPTRPRARWPSASRDLGQRQRPPGRPGGRAPAGGRSRRPRAAGCRAGSGRAAAPGRRSSRLSPSATAWPPPLPNTSIRSSQCGQGSQDMFSTTPAICWWVCSAMVPARSATSAAACCGVVTTSSSAGGTSWATEMAMSPVPGGQVHQQHVEVAPVDVGEELLQRAVQHRAAPHDRLVVGDEHADRDDLHVVGHRRQDHVLDLGGAALDAEHPRAPSGRRCRRPRRRPPARCGPSRRRG